MGKPERVRLTAAVNRILWPRLLALGFHFQIPEDGPKWKEGRGIARVGPHGRHQGLFLGRDKFGNRFGVLLARQLLDGSYEYLKAEAIGLSTSSLSYTTQAQAEQVLERVAGAIESGGCRWLDEDPPVPRESVGDGPSNNALNLTKRDVLLRGRLH